MTLDVEKLIAEVLHRVPIWNQAHPDHHNRHVLTKLWNEIASELDVTRDAAQKKWKYLRDYFRAECAKVPKLKSGDEGGNKCFKSNWPQYESMKFLLNQMKNRPSSGNLTELTSSKTHPSSTSNSSQQASPPAIVIVGPPDHQPEDLTEMNSLPEDEEEVGANKNLEEEIGETCADEPRYTIPNRKRKNRNEAIGNALIEIEKQKWNYFKSRKVETVTEPTSADEDKNFFFSLLPHVKIIRPESKLLFRNEIQEVVQRFAYAEHYFHAQRPASRHSTSVNSRSTPMSTIDSSSGFCPMSPAAETGQVLEETNSILMASLPSQGLMQQNNNQLVNYNSYQSL